MSENKTFSVQVSTTSAKKIGVSSNVSENPITATSDTGLYYSQLAKNWAIGEGLIENTDYSSKAYAQESKAYALDSKAYSESASLDLNNLNNAITQYDEQITNTVATGLAEITTLQESSLLEIETLRTNAVEDITTNKTNALFDITSAENKALANIETDLNKATSEINTNRANTLAQISTLANTSISDINAVGKSYDNITHKNITNCLLEVPQRLKIEVVDGYFILKAGSEVIVPNGFENDGVTRRFDYVEITEDLKFINKDCNDQVVISVRVKPSPTLYSCGISSFTVTQLPNSPYDYCIYYNTTENKCYFYTPTQGWQDGFSFSIAIATRVTAGFASVDQVFNGFGYIGSTIWVDKGVKGLIPNGRNEDGSCKNKEFTTNKLQTYSFSDNEERHIVITKGFVLSSISKPRTFFVTEADKPKTLASTGYSFCYTTDTNLIYWSQGSTTANWKLIAENGGTGAIIGTANFNSGQITSFNPKQPFRAVDYNDALLNSDKNIISSWGMPSSKYINLNLGASGSQYTAPANGWFYLQKVAKGSQYVLMSNLSSHPFNSGINLLANETCYLFLPCKKGDVITIQYNATGDTQIFVFRYAEGEV